MNIVAKFGILLVPPVWGTFLVAVTRLRHRALPSRQHEVSVRVRAWLGFLHLTRRIHLDVPRQPGPALVDLGLQRVDVDRL